MIKEIRNLVFRHQVQKPPKSERSHSLITHTQGSHLAAIQREKCTPNAAAETFSKFVSIMLFENWYQEIHFQSSTKFKAKSLLCKKHVYIGNIPN